MPWGVDTVFAAAAPMLGATDNRAYLDMLDREQNERMAKMGFRTKSTPTMTGTTGGTGVGGMPQSLGGGTSPEQIIQLVNEINQAAQQTANQGRIPQGAALEQLSSGNISSALSGQLDQSVINQLAQRQAERGAQMGIATGSPSNNAAYLKAIGLNSLDLMNQGQNWLTQAVGRNPAAPIYNAGNMVLTPEQQAQIDLENRRLQEQIRSNQAQEALARMRGDGRSFGGGGGGMPTQRSSGGGGGTLPDLFAPNSFQSTPTTSGSFTSSWPTAQPGQSTSLYNMGGNYFNDTIVSPGGTSYTAPNSLADTGWNDYFDSTFYGGTNNPVNFFEPVGNLSGNTGWENDAFEDIWL